METLHDKICNKLSVLVTVISFIMDKDEAMARSFYQMIGEDFSGMILLSKEYSRPDLEKKIQSLSLFILTLENYMEGKSEKRWQEIETLAKEGMITIDEIEKLSL